METNQGLDRMEVLTEHTDPLTEENTAALLLSSYCVQSVLCVYFYFALIYYVSCNFFSYFVSAFFFNFFCSKSLQLRAWTTQGEL